MSNEFKVKNGIKFPDGSVQTTAATGGSSATWSKKTANYTAISGDKILADTSGGAFTITLPATPSVGNSVIVADGQDWSTTNLTIGRNSTTIEGVAEDLILDLKGTLVELVYDGSTWEVFASATVGGSTGGSSGISTGKAIAMAMIFGG